MALWIHDHCDHELDFSHFITKAWKQNLTSVKLVQRFWAGQYFLEFSTGNMSWTLGLLALFQHSVILIVPPRWRRTIKGHHWSLQSNRLASVQHHLRIRYFTALLKTYSQQVQVIQYCYIHPVISVFQAI